ncbi:uncharacterized protein L203_106078 [Cryptococcus depauperatus CBS 7841]|uniref:Uncharacterized protein n=1 Tax=Cryptococcus depauperatus CBS 7841 TaxID=1295531 RepID=A0AAJ8M344_9TREE
MTTITLDDNSNAFSYGGEAWSIVHTKDPYTGKYFGSTFHSSIVANAWMRLCWTGTDITIYGAKRINHGLYSVVVDNGDVQMYNGYSDPEQFQVILYTSQGLKQGNHQIVLANRNDMNAIDGHIYLDIDYASLPPDTTSSPTVPATPPPSGSTSTVTVGSTTTVVGGSINATPQPNKDTASGGSSGSSGSGGSGGSGGFTGSSTSSGSIGSSGSSSGSTIGTASNQPRISLTSITGPGGINGAKPNGAVRGVNVAVEQIALLGVVGWYLRRFLR